MHLQRISVSLTVGATLPKSHVSRTLYPNHINHFSFFLDRKLKQHEKQIVDCPSLTFLKILYENQSVNSNWLVPNKELFLHQFETLLSPTTTILVRPFHIPSSNDIFSQINLILIFSYIRTNYFMFFIGTNYLIAICENSIKACSLPILIVL